jgi:hypothetical protein
MNVNSYFNISKDGVENGIKNRLLQRWRRILFKGFAQSKGFLR